MVTLQNHYTMLVPASYPQVYSIYGRYDNIVNCLRRNLKKTKKN